MNIFLDGKRRILVQRGLANSRFGEAAGRRPVGEEQSFRDLILRVRSGDEQAAEELVRCYEPAIRRAVRVRLRNLQLRRLLDSMDICQSVLLNFFVRVAAGQYELETSEELLKLLTTMARNKLINQAEHQRAQRRDHRRTTSADAAEWDAVAPGSSPSQQVAARELLLETRRRLTPDERQLLELREQGQEWTEIAKQLGASAEALRKKLSRAVDRVGHELGLDEVGHE
jgi:RNA polymerase sigma factor (sigma-70 family)